MDDDGGRIWKKMTTDNVGKQVAVVLDNEVYSAPLVNEPIPGGSTSISGGFDDITEATDLANILSIGKLPSKPVIIEEAVIGPSLGAATVSAGLLSLAIGFVLVLLFMLGYYGAAGVIAVMCLFLNIFFILGALSSFGVVLTFAGIAGIVLTIGMAVDASVIIFERIREELRAGEHWKDAISNGFKYSYSAIFDANVTTLAVAVILSFYGLGPIKGFAAVLIIGVLCSVFSAVLVGRMLFANRTDKNKEVSVWSGWSKNILANPGIDFLSKRKLAYGISGVVLTLGIVSMIARGFELGIDLEGGRSYTIEFSEAVNTQELKGEIVKAFGTVTVPDADKESANKVLVREFSKNTQTKITTSFLQTSEMDANIDSIILLKVYEASKNYSGGTTSYADFESAVANSGDKPFFMTANSKVGATIADDIRDSAGWAAGLSLLFIFFYLLLRFNRWQYSAGALAALVHDVLFVLSIFSILRGVLPFSLEINQEFIAAILTVIGYSINDTVVVFDRIREVGREMQEKASFKEIANSALNSTISRTTITSLTTLLVVLILFIFGGDGIRGFAFALVIGVLVGTYSSIFIATPIVADTTGDANIFDAPEAAIENAPEDDSNMIVPEA
jgi:SecD/SecF fusion protein